MVIPSDSHFGASVALRHGAELHRFFLRHLADRDCVPGLAQKAYLRVKNLEDMRDPGAYLFMVANQVLNPELVTTASEEPCTTVERRSMGRGTCVRGDAQRFAELRSRAPPPRTISPCDGRNVELNSAPPDERSPGGIFPPQASYGCRRPFHKNRGALGQLDGYAASRRSRNTRDTCNHRSVQIMVHTHSGSLRTSGSCLAAVHNAAANPFKDELGAA